MTVINKVPKKTGTDPNELEPTSCSEVIAICGFHEVPKRKSNGLTKSKNRKASNKIETVTAIVIITPIPAVADNAKVPALSIFLLVRKFMKKFKENLMRKIRLFVAQNNLSKGTTIKLCDNDFDYLVKVMRQKIGDIFYVFNGLDGEFEVKIVDIEKKNLRAQIERKISDLIKSPNVTIAFAPVKNVRTDFIAQKATELGVSRFQPIITQRTIVDKINLERFRANVKEACEQCERNDFAEIFAPKKLDKFIGEDAAKNKIFILCDESGQAQKASKVLPNIDFADREIVVLVGPEGGFAETEFLQMRKLQNLYPISLGPRILRADTAMISALTLVQEFL